VVIAGRVMLCFKIARVAREAETSATGNRAGGPFYNGARSLRGPWCWQSVWHLLELGKARVQDLLPLPINVIKSATAQ